VVANLVPREVSAMVEASKAVGAKRPGGATRPCSRSRDLLGLAPKPIPVKAAILMLGCCHDEVRLPLDAHSLGVVRRNLVRHGLLTESA
jgi:4-hydroxy-tetrahydrodipicolinate synthase